MTEINEELKVIIDRMSYKSLLKRWRCGKPGDPMFLGETGKYYAVEMERKKMEHTPEERVAISKEVGHGD